MPIRSQRRGARGTVGHPYSPLNLRLMFASFGLLACAVLAFVSFRAGLPVLAVGLALLAVVAMVDLVVIQRRRSARRREAPGADHSLFE
ncbi:MAG TPA: DUF6343 family protein [Natronosporangium sp.]